MECEDGTATAFPGAQASSLPHHPYLSRRLARHSSLAPPRQVTALNRCARPFDRRLISCLDPWPWSSFRFDYRQDPFRLAMDPIP